MAFLQEITCSKCHLPKNVATQPGRPLSTVCDDCQKDAAVDMRTKALDKLKTRTNEDRLALLEIQMYDLRHPVAKDRHRL